MMAALFGIHVGNTSACLAIWKDEDRVEIVANDAGDRVTPTIVQYTPDNCIVGRAAQLEQFKNESNTIIRNKQLLNENISDTELQNLRSHVAYKIIKSDKHLKYEFSYEDKPHYILPIDILGIIIKKIYAIAKAAAVGSKELNSVICVPLYFSMETVDAIKDIVKKVGFNVLQVIDEPSSAALAAGIGCRMEEQPYHCLVYRIGGVTLDATILFIQDGILSVVDSVYKYNISGTLFTEKLAEFLTNEFKRQYKSAELNKRSKYKLYAVAENVKQILSVQNLAQCSAESVGGGFDLSCSVSRARFENIIAPYLVDIIAFLREVLDKSSLSTEQIKKVVLCGGSMKIPKLQEVLRSNLTNAEIIVGSCPDELISIGAAMQAGFCMKYQVSPEKLAIKVPCLSAALIIKVKTDESESFQKFVVLENSSLPIKRHYEVTSVKKFVHASIDVISNKVINLGNVDLNNFAEPVTFVIIDLDINKDGKLLLTITNEASSEKNYFKCNLNRICTL